MDIQALKVKNRDFTGKDVASLPVHPSAEGMRAADLQAAFDRAMKEVMVPKFNALVDAVGAVQAGGVTPDGRLLTSEDIMHAVAGTPAGGTVSDFLARSMTHQANFNNPHRLTKQTLGLGNVDNTSDANKPLSIAAKQAMDKLATKEELDLKVDKSVLDDLGGGKRVADAVIGTRTAGWTDKDCDYLCDGANDQVEFQKAIDGLTKKGACIYVLPGAYNISSPINVDKSLITFREASSAYLYSEVKNGVIFNVSGHGCVFDGFSFGGDKDTAPNSTFIETNAAQLSICNMRMWPSSSLTSNSYPGGCLLNITKNGTDISIMHCYINARVFIKAAEDPGYIYGGVRIMGSYIYLSRGIHLPGRTLYVLGSSIAGEEGYAVKDFVAYGSAVSGEIIASRNVGICGSLVGGAIRANKDVSIAGSSISGVTAGGRSQIEGTIN